MILDRDLEREDSSKQSLYTVVQMLHHENETSTCKAATESVFLRN
jgi:hypothetical protein